MSDGRNWYDLNGSRSYPLDDAATGEGTGGELPLQFLADVKLLFPASLGDSARIGTAKFSTALAAVTFVSDTGVPLAAVSVPRRTLGYGRIYPVDALAPHVGGFVVFGGECPDFAIAFTDVSESQLALAAAHPFPDPPLPGFGRVLAPQLTGLVSLQGSGDLEVSVANRIVNGAMRRVIIWSLGSGSGSRNPLDVYRGRCTGRPESGTCNPPAVERLGDVEPDDLGVIRIRIEPADQFRVSAANNNGNTAIVECKLAFDALCGTRASARVAVEDPDTPACPPDLIPGDPPPVPFQTDFVTEDETFLRAVRGGFVHGGNVGLTTQPGTNLALWCPPNASELVVKPTLDPEPRRIETVFQIDPEAIHVYEQYGGVVLGWRPNSTGMQYFQAVLNPVTFTVSLFFWTGRQRVLLDSIEIPVAQASTDPWYVAGEIVQDATETYKLKITAGIPPAESTAPLGTLEYTSPAVVGLTGDRYGIIGSKNIEFTHFHVFGTHT